MEQGNLFARIHLCVLYGIAHLEWRNGKFIDERRTQREEEAERERENDRERRNMKRLDLLAINYISIGWCSFARLNCIPSSYNKTTHVSFERNRKRTREIARERDRERQSAFDVIDLVWHLTKAQIISIFGPKGNDATYPFRNLYWRYTIYKRALTLVDTISDPLIKLLLFWSQSHSHAHHPYAALISSAVQAYQIVRIFVLFF